MKHLNRASKVLGPACRHHLKQDPNQEIYIMISLIAEPAKDEDFIQLI